MAVPSRKYQQPRASSQKPFGVARTLMAATALVLATPAAAKDPTPAEILAKYDEVMGPKTFEGDTEMTATREDGSTRTYVMHMLKGDDDKFRIWFKEPASVK